QGQRAYALARAGAPPTLAARPVLVESIEATAFALPRVTVTIRCGSGTYVRSLARDSGALLGVGGHVGWLRRVAVGPFTLADAVSMTDAIAASAAGRFAELLLPITAGLVGWRILTVDEATAARLARGQAIPATDDIADRAAAVTTAGQVVALLARHDRQWRPRKVFASDPAREQPA
ncbi:MAG: tRNA pseudouridine(55) synthase TruB, partial [Dehalococcoidia bacterium]|nr:tRNA pseudouridine(55) synthase TruB [Dehalococcoidia bacterium]